MRTTAVTFALALMIGAAPCAAAPMIVTDYDAFLAATTARIEDHFDVAPWAEGDHAGPMTSLGTTWSAASTLRSTAFMPRSGGLALSDVDAAVNDVPDVLTATLPGGTTAAGLWVRGGAAWLQAEFAALAADGTVLASVSGWVPTSYVFFGVVSDSAVHQVRVRALETRNDDFIVDDFVRGAAAVPEPGALALALAGLAGATVRRTRARRRPASLA